MSLFVRVLFLVGALAIAAAIAGGMMTKGMEYTSWVAGTIAALSIACGLVMRAFMRGVDDRDTTRDRVDQRQVRAKGRIVGKSGGSAASADLIRQTRLEADGDVIGKQEFPNSDSDR
ncbi:hypothetical protein [Saccharopolyspora sp. NPDC049426]|uniref:hypothetical protein n=1 Tax=Saccharopolyspora sp. NPDC049426 TaxID=3155652 RepID=UPI003413CF28